MMTQTCFHCSATCAMGAHVPHTCLSSSNSARSETVVGTLFLHSASPTCNPYEVLILIKVPSAYHVCTSSVLRGPSGIRLVQQAHLRVCTAPTHHCTTSSGRYISTYHLFNFKNFPFPPPRTFVSYPCQPEGGSERGRDGWRVHNLSSFLIRSDLMRLYKKII